MKKIIIIGAGPCGLFTATKLLENPNIKVELYDHKASIGNKFLVAGKSGLNLTHSNRGDLFTNNYYNHKGLFDEWFKSFDNDDLINWTNSLGIETFIGTSGRVFPKQFKAAQFLKIWFDKLKESKNFSFHPHSCLSGFSGNEVKINGNIHEFDYLVMALGGASWPKTGSTGEWVKFFDYNDVSVNVFYSINCGFNYRWSQGFLSENSTLPIKYVKLWYKDNSIKGDLMLTDWGLEGSPLYFLSHYIQIDDLGSDLRIDLKPDLTEVEIIQKLSGKKSISSKLKSILDENSIKLLKELTSKDEFLNIEKIASKIKNLNLRLKSSRPIEEAISTGGGVCLSEVSRELSLKKFPNIYIGGEMLD